MAQLLSSSSVRFQLCDPLHFAASLPPSLPLLLFCAFLFLTPSPTPSFKHPPILVAGELLAVAAPFMEQQEHPVVVIAAYLRALDDALTILTDDIATPIDTTDKEALLSALQAVVGTKMLRKWSRLACEIALDAVQTVFREDRGQKEIDIKRYAKVRLTAALQRLTQPKKSISMLCRVRACHSLCR